MEEPFQPAVFPSKSKGQSPSLGEGEGKCCITVAVRVRPFLHTEAVDAHAHVLAVDNNRITLRDPNKKSKSNPSHQFNFDEVLWSANTPGAGSLPVASQQDVYEAVGHPLLQNLIRGYNACLLCYGQTGSGKTYTMTGTPTEPGIVPRYAEAVFQFLQDQQHVNEISAYRVQVSYMEIYNEKVHDLLAGKTPQHKNLRVRQHPVRGSFVEGLSQHNVQSSATILKLVRQGNEQRATAATRMNDRSSRSHAIVTIEVSQQAVISQTGTEDLFSSKTSRVYLVDLAGSERMAKSDVDLGARFQEMTSINQSLSTLSRVIEALSDPSGTAKRAPYRESLLTWLLMDSFGGNSKTTMIATVSPALSNAAETLSTLRYASRARKIVNKAVINEDPSVALMGALQAETQQLRAQLAEMTEKNTMLMDSRVNAEEVAQLRTKLQFSETLIEELKEHEENERLTWEKRLASLKRESNEARQLAAQRSSEATERQLDKAWAEVRRRAEEVTVLQRTLAEKEEELAAGADCQQQLQEELCAKEVEILGQEAQLMTIRSDWGRLEAHNAEMLAQVRQEVVLREVEFQERQRWEQQAKAMEEQAKAMEQQAKAMELRLQEEIAQRHAAEQMLAEVLHGEREAIKHAANAHQQLGLAADLFGTPLLLREVPGFEVQGDAVSCCAAEGNESHATVQRVAEGATEEGFLAGSNHFAQTLVEEYARLLQSLVESRKEWKDLYDGLALTMQAVSGKPRFAWLPWGPKGDPELQSALRRQEELNSRAAGWLLGLQMQREVLKQNVEVQLRINQRLARERDSLQLERNNLQAELCDVSGRFQRAMGVIRRIHHEIDGLRATDA
eukprot:GGOE01012765.1.p1 GENE.GGOE01012765.1~~GGOE01012765.1.p1  ORF type:complete len:967 (+),score=274.32 GGOE01012765.1:370-2901(+)